MTSQVPILKGEGYIKALCKILMNTLGKNAGVEKVFDKFIAGTMPCN